MTFDTNSGHDPLHVEMLCADLLVQALSHDLDRPALEVFGGETVSARDLRDVTSRYAQAFAALGIGRGHRVAVLSKNRPEVVYVANALTLTGSCIAALHPMGSAHDFAYILEDAGIDTLVYDPQYFETTAGELRARVQGLKRLLALGPSVHGTNFVESARTFAPAPLRVAQVAPSDLIRIAYSGGTTGQPKGIMISQRAWAAMVNILMTDWEWPDEIRHLVCAPLSHSGVSVLLPVLLRGGVLVIAPGFEPESFMQTVQERRITTALVVPTMIYALLDHPRFGAYDLSSLKTVFYGASSISPMRLREAIERIGPVFFQFYGQAEAPMAVTGMRRGEHDATSLNRLASCGRPSTWTRVVLLDDDGNESPPGRPGEICVRGPLVFSGYVNKPEQTGQAMAGHWLRTGDVAIRDEQGFLFIVDRKKDMIITGGFNVYPREVEDVISTHPAVSAVGVVGVPDEHWGEAVKAVVVLRPGAAVQPSELIALVRESKGPVQAPKSIDFVDSLPLTGLGKPDKKALRERYLRPQPH